MTAIMDGPCVPIEAIGLMVRFEIDSPLPLVRSRKDRMMAVLVSKVRNLAMNLQTTRGIWQLVFMLAGGIPASLGFAQIPNPLQRAGRLYGVCWSDGYHACKSSGIHPLADLPPAQRTAITVSDHFPVKSAHTAGRTFYDRFDAINRSSCDSEGCDTPGCQGCSEGSSDCDSAWNTDVTGSADDVQLRPTAGDPVKHD